MKRTMERTVLILVIVQLLLVNLITVPARNDITRYTEGEKTEINQINISFISSEYTLYGEIYYPSNFSRRYPGIVFCEGDGGYVSAYNWIPKALAEAGYVAIIFDFPGQGKSEGIFPNWSLNIPLLNIYLRYSFLIETPIHYALRNLVTATSDALTYLIEESSVKNLVNNSSIGLIGHSLGGITVTESAIIDDRIDAVVALSQGNPRIIKKIEIPIQFQGGCFDIFTWSIPIVTQCYKKANTPKELIVIQGGTHFGFSTALGPLCPCPRWQKDIILRYSIGWFDYFLKNKTDAYNVITTGTDHLSRFIKSKYNFGEGDINLE
jgi:predicted dienelactone hydrolase